MEWHHYIKKVTEDELTLYALPIFFLAIFIEWILTHREQKDLYEGKDFLVSMSMMVLSGLAEFLPKIFAFIAFDYLHRISPLADVVGRQWWAWLLLFLLDDFAYYWFHRSNHEVRILWAGHVTHHSSEHLNYGTALRQGVGERLHKFFFWMWIPLLGFDPMMMFMMIGINLFYQFWTHTESIRRMPAWFEYIFNTPSHHRVHHASNIRYLDRNHAGVLILWDRLFGTFSQELDTEAPKYGLTVSLNSFHPGYVATHEYQAIWKDVRRAAKWSDKLKYMFYAPGWSHDGEDKRAATLRSNYKL